MPEGIGYGNPKKKNKVGKNVSKSRAHPSQKKKTGGLLKGIFGRKPKLKKNVRNTKANKEVQANRKKKVSTGGFLHSTHKIVDRSDRGRNNALLTQASTNLGIATNEAEINKAIKNMSFNNEATQNVVDVKGSTGRNKTFKQKRKGGRIVFK